MYSDAGQFCLGGEFSGAIGGEWMECMGSLRGDWIVTGHVAGDGNRV